MCQATTEAKASSADSARDAQRKSAQLVALALSFLPHMELLFTCLIYCDSDAESQCIQEEIFVGRVEFYVTVVVEEPSYLTSQDV